MKGMICYYSGSGNTKLAVEYIKNKLSEIDFTLFDIKNNKIPDFSEYDIVGFATFADFWGPPKLMYDFLEKITIHNKILSFVFNTYGFISGGTLNHLKKLVETKGFNVISAFSLHTPENFPPMRKSGKDFDNAPDKKEMMKFINDIDFLKSQIKDINSDTPIKKKLNIGFIETLIPLLSRKHSKKDMGNQNVNKELCIKCGICKKVCPYSAIDMIDYPEFYHDKCYGCWACYNHCSKKAIYTTKFKGEFQYSKPSLHLISELKK